MKVNIEYINFWITADRVKYLLFLYKNRNYKKAQ